ncbi:MAG: hypothetical protein J5925_03125 [Clostridia bacterium]|nr:hypothetical protein [Clostridia bacterium]MBR5746268.1 hypothetical protein [Clostridia bacterium]
MKDVLFAAAAFAAGVLVSFVNYIISKKTLHGGKTTVAATVRSLISASFLLLLFFIGMETSLPVAALLIGGALGLTAGLILFTWLLLKNYGGKGRGDK